MKKSVIGSAKARLYLAIACVAVASMVAQPLVAGAETAPAPLSPVLLRTSKNFHYPDPWEAVCGSDFCGIPLIVRFPFDTPVNEQNVDVDIALSFNFKVSSGDKIEVEAGFEGDGGRRTAFSPGSYPLMSPSPELRTSTTLTWSAKALPAAGAHYVIVISVNPRHGKGGRNVLASGTRAALTVTEESSRG
ncbi:MAG: hypothetical protein QOD46_290 [Actinomycetota bacterium]|jgi:hypothetical protein|nr:hypothetical protein [Actinomycetota bacterium]